MILDVIVHLLVLVVDPDHLNVRYVTLVVFRVLLLVVVLLVVILLTVVVADVVLLLLHPEVEIVEEEGTLLKINKK